MAKKNKGWDYLNSDDVNDMSDDVVGTNEGSAENVLCQGIIPKAPQDSDSFFEV